MEANSKLITIPELAKRLGVSKPKMYAMSRREGFPVYRFGPRGAKVVWEEVVEWINQNVKGALE